MKRRNAFLSIIVLLPLLLYIFPQKAYADDLPAIVPGTIPGSILKGAVRFRNFSSGAGSELYLGLAGLPEGSRTEVDFSGGKACDGSFPLGTWLASNHVIFEYYPIPGKVTATVIASHKYCLTYPTGPLGKLDYIQLDLVNQSPDASISLTNVKFNSIVDGSFVGAGSNSWYFAGQDFSLGFKLEGDLVISGTPADGELNMLQFSVGEIPVAVDVQAPLIKDLVVSPNPAILNQPVNITALVDDTMTGGSTILSAEYTLDGGKSWNSLAPVNGIFDQNNEPVTGNFVAAPITLNQVCVRGADSANNTSVIQCAKLTISYIFVGFLKPIQMGEVHSIRAGRTIPLKWGLSDYNGLPIDDPSSFQGLFSYSVDCGTLSGDASQSIEEFGPGQSGLEYNAENIWHFNWQTHEEYKGTCRAMFVRLSGGTISPVVIFKFR